MTDRPKDAPLDDPAAQEIRTKDGTTFKVPVEGSLGLLAIGYRGLMAWRAVRKKAGTTPTSNDGREA